MNHHRGTLARLAFVVACVHLAGCDSGPVADSHKVAYEDSTVAATLDMLVEAENRRSRRDEAASIPVSVERVEALEQRIVELELQISRIQTTGVLPASTIGFDPRATTLTGQDVQSALTELHTRTKALEEKGDASMGQPGPGMFTRVSPQGAQQGMMQGGQQGMMQGGQQQQGMMQGGQQQQGMMQGGQQQGMMQGGQQQQGMMQGGQQQGGQQQGGQMQGGPSSSGR